MITVSAFRWVPPFAQGLVRDLRVRWALEEAGLPYEVRLIGPEDQGTMAYRGLQHGSGGSSSPEEAVKLLAQSNYVGADSDVLMASMTGKFTFGEGDTRDTPEFKVLAYRVLPLDRAG